MNWVVTLWASWLHAATITWATCEGQSHCPLHPCVGWWCRWRLGLWQNRPEVLGTYLTGFGRGKVVGALCLITAVIEVSRFQTSHAQRNLQTKTKWITFKKLLFTTKNILNEKYLTIKNVKAIFSENVFSCFPPNLKAENPHWNSFRSYPSLVWFRICAPITECSAWDSKSVHKN